MNSGDVTIAQLLRRMAVPLAGSGQNEGLDDSFAALIGADPGEAPIMTGLVPAPVPMETAVPVREATAPRPDGADPRLPRHASARIESIACDADRRDRMQATTGLTAVAAPAPMMAAVTVFAQERHLPHTSFPVGPGRLATIAAVPASQLDPVQSLTLRIDLDGGQHVMLTLQCRDGLIDLTLQPDTSDTRALVLERAAEIRQVLAHKGIAAGPVVIAGEPDIAGQAQSAVMLPSAPAESFARSTQSQVSLPYAPQHDLPERRRGGRRHHF